MAGRSNQECLKQLENIANNFNEYSTEEVDITEERVKPKILDVLKTHKAVKLADYEYGQNLDLKKDHRLIIREPEDRSKVLEYGLNSHTQCWTCLNTNFKGEKQCISPPLRIKYGIVFAPIYHRGICQTKDYSYVMKMQNLLKQGKKNEAQGLARKTGLAKKKQNLLNNVSSQSFSTSLPNDRSNTLSPEASESNELQSPSSISRKNKRKTKTALVKRIHQQTTFTNLNGSPQLFDGTPRNASKNYNQSTHNDDLDNEIADTTSTANLTPQIRQQRKRATNTSISERPFTRSERYRASNESNSIRISHSPSDYSTAEDNEIKTDIPRKSSPPGDFDNPSRPLSRSSPNLPEAASTSNETILNETKPFLTPFPSNAVATTFDDAQSELNRVPLYTSSLPFSDALPINESTFGISSLDLSGNNSSSTTSTLNSSNLKRKNKDNAVEEDVENALPKRPKVEKMEEEDDDEIFIIEDSDPVDQKPEIRPNNDPLAVQFPFEIPSSSILKEICEKLNINYNKQAYQLWLKIDFEEVPSISLNIKLHHLKSKNIFECFSLLFTGDTDQYFRIHNAIDLAFRNKLLRSGSMSQKEIDRTFVPPTVSDEHLAFIAEFLNCRIAIFKESKLCRYGKWDSEADILTFVLTFVNGCYSIVLSL